MGSTLEEEIIKNKIPIPISNLITIIEFIFITSIIIVFSYNYIDYYKSKGIVTKIDNNYYIKVKIFNKDIDTLTNNNKIIIDNKVYKYNIKYFQNKLYISNKENYRYIYLQTELEDKYKIPDYIVDFKVEKQRKKIYKYLFSIGGNN